MRGEKTIDLGFTFEVSQDGKYVPVSEVTVRAPDYRRADIHDTMTVWVGKAVMGFAKYQSALQVAADQVEHDEDEKPMAPDDEVDVMQIMSMGLSVEEYPKFTAYVRRTLTNSERATCAGGVKLQDEAWEAIYENGGMEAIKRIEGVFVGFFFDALGSKKKTGAGKSRTSSSRTKAGSRSKQPTVSPG